MHGETMKFVIYWCLTAL